MELLAVEGEVVLLEGVLLDDEPSVEVDDVEVLEELSLVDVDEELFEEPPRLSVL